MQVIVLAIVGLLACLPLPYVLADAEGSSDTPDCAELFQPMSAETPVQQLAGEVQRTFRLEWRRGGGVDGTRRAKRTGKFTPLGPDDFGGEQCGGVRFVASRGYRLKRCIGEKDDGTLVRPQVKTRKRCRITYYMPGDHIIKFLRVQTTGRAERRTAASTDSRTQRLAGKVRRTCRLHWVRGGGIGGSWACKRRARISTLGPDDFNGEERGALLAKCRVPRCRLTRCRALEDDGTPVRMVKTARRCRVDFELVDDIPISDLYVTVVG